MTQYQLGHPSKSPKSFHELVYKIREEERRRHIRDRRKRKYKDNGISLPTTLYRPKSVNKN